MVVIVNNTVWYTVTNAKRVDIKCAQHTHTVITSCMERLVNPTLLVILLQSISAWSQHIVSLQLTPWDMSIIGSLTLPSQRKASLDNIYMHEHEWAPVKLPWQKWVVGPNFPAPCFARMSGTRETCRHTTCLLTPYRTFSSLCTEHGFVGCTSNKYLSNACLNL